LSILSYLYIFFSVFLYNWCTFKQKILISVKLKKQITKLRLVVWRKTTLKLKIMPLKTTLI